MWVIRSIRAEKYIWWHAMLKHNMYTQNKRVIERGCYFNIKKIFCKETTLTYVERLKGCVLFLPISGARKNLLKCFLNVLLFTSSKNKNQSPDKNIRWKIQMFETCIKVICPCYVWMACLDHEDKWLRSKMPHVNLSASSQTSE